MSDKILIVDDEPHIRSLLEQALEELEDQGVELLTAADGVRALDTIEKEKPKLVILDIMMPKLDGYSVCEKVKHDRGLDDVHIIMVTAKGQGFDRTRGEAAGADGFMTKPFDPDEILQRAQAVLGR